MRVRRLSLPSAAWMAFGALLAAALGLRAWAMIVYPPAVLNGHAHDGANYIQAAHYGLSKGDQEPLGYPIFLRIVHAVSHELTFTIGVQHALGLLTGTLLFMTARRLGASVWLALVPAAVVWLGGDELFLEHAPLSEPLFTPLLAATLYAGVRSLDGATRWQLATGVLAVALLAVRSVALPLPLLIICWVMLARWRTRLPVVRSVALVAGASVIAALAYGAVHDKATGRWSIVAGGSGWDLYARAEEFADCRDFTPPPGTAVLCDNTAPSGRAGPEYYLYDGGPAHAAFGEPAGHDGLVRAFAVAAIIHQPLDFVGFAGTDLIRYFDPNFGRLRLGDYVGPAGVAFPSGTPALDPDTVREVSAYYGNVPRPRPGEADGLRSYQSVMRVSGPMLLGLLVIGFVGLILSKGRLRWGLALALLIVLDLLLLPTLTHAEWRMAVPAEGPAAVAAVAAAPLLARRVRIPQGISPRSSRYARIVSTSRARARSSSSEWKPS